MKKGRNTKKIKAFGLVEILVSLLIYGIAIIGVTSLTVSSYRIVKDNEIGDLGNSIMVRGIEYFKSANAIASLLPPDSGDTYVFKVDSSGGNAIGEVNAVFTPQFVTDVTTPLITDCDSTSDYKLNFSANLNQVDMCNQIIVTKTANRDYLIQSIIVVRLSDRLDQNELVGLRPRLEQ